MKKNFLIVGLIVFFVQQISANPIPSGSALTIVAPTTLTIPGNYRLGNDISGPIVIDTDNVEIDLENRTITGGINSVSVSNHQNVTIKNAD